MSSTTGKSTAPLLAVSGAVAVTCAFASALLLTTVRQHCVRAAPVRHAAVAITLIPVALVLSYLLCIVYRDMATTAHTFAKEHAAELPWPLVYAIAAMRPPASHVGLAEALWMTCFLFASYAAVNVLHHLVDVTRLLKASRRRLLLPEMRELRRREGAAAAAKAQRHR
ncbi:hypothetical protein NESM_000538300 [Novymonas esmeraldas]|uniref:Uncharacterized protein n=1 Tax=Novymonas esmeraldas TaxID=1808958 RepID=A0AAW0EPF3_9TRYP